MRDEKQETIKEKKNTKTKILRTYILHKFYSVNLMLDSGTEITQYMFGKNNIFTGNIAAEDEDDDNYEMDMVVYTMAKQKNYWLITVGK